MNEEKNGERRKRDRRLVRRGFRMDAIGDVYVDNAIREVDRDLATERETAELAATPTCTDPQKNEAG